MQEDNGIIDRLYQSFADLEKAILGAKKTLESKEEVPREVVERLNSYDGILAKQKKLADELCQHIQSGNWDQVSRHVGLINGLSAMIRDDARAILSSLALNSDTEEQDGKIHFC
ncbi:MAG: hypothetical protein KDD60_06230 [Bdellovibrionales bacterium]|nr:hypothetical protein [Bdellovibrionales bacterium]